MKKPMTTAEFFKLICNILEEQEKLPSILDYHLSTDHPVNLVSEDFNFMNALDYGSSEGIYLDLWIEYKGESKKSLGTFKTLEQSDEAMHIMANLLADFVTVATDYVNNHLDDFTWAGYDVFFEDGLGHRSATTWSYGNLKGAQKQKNKMLEIYPTVVIRDNVTRKETVYH